MRVGHHHPEFWLAGRPGREASPFEAAADASMSPLRGEFLGDASVSPIAQPTPRPRSAAAAPAPHQNIAQCVRARADLLRVSDPFGSRTFPSAAIAPASCWYARGRDRGRLRCVAARAGDEGSVLHHSERIGPLVEHDDQRRDPLGGHCAGRRSTGFHRHNSLRASRARQRRAQAPPFGRIGPKSCAAIGGTVNLRQRLDTVPRGIEHRSLQAGSSPGSKKFKICRRPSGRSFDPKRLNRRERIEITIFLTCPDVSRSRPAQPSVRASYH